MNADCELLLANARQGHFYIALPLLLGLSLGCEGTVSDPNGDYDSAYAEIAGRPPRVDIVGPAGGAILEGVVSVTGTAVSHRGITSVEVRVDSAAYQPAQGTTSWSYSLRTSDFAPGSHVLSVQATDSAGEEGVG